MPRPSTPPAPLLAMPTYALSLLGREAHDRMAHWLPEGLRLGHLAVLGALAEADARAQRELSAQLRIHPSDMVTLIDDLARRELISRTTDPADRRRNLIGLTAPGTQARAAGDDGQPTDPSRAAGRALARRAGAGRAAARPRARLTDCSRERRDPSATT